MPAAPLISWNMGKQLEIFKVSVPTVQVNKYTKDTENKSPHNLFCTGKATSQKLLIKQCKRKTSYPLAVEMV